jgi:hypothetical protein
MLDTHFVARIYTDCRQAGQAFSAHFRGQEADFGA